MEQFVGFGIDSSHESKLSWVNQKSKFLGTADN